MSSDSSTEELSRTQLLHQRWRVATEAASAHGQSWKQDPERRHLCEAATEAEEALLSAPVTNLRDLALKTEVLRTNIGVSSLDSGLAHQAVLAVCEGIEGLVASQGGEVAFRASRQASDLTNIDSNALAYLFDLFEMMHSQWLAVSCQPIFVRSGNQAGFPPSLVDIEASRVANARDRIADEIRKRTPRDPSERDTLLSIRIKDEILCEGRILDRDLLLDAVKAWG
ncbi:hypothetical protein MKK51_22345 [Methylobacterium sp. E-045]|nr:hypothetical protein [Methylobacterium sp. E-045]